MTTQTEAAVQRVERKVRETIKLLESIVQAWSPDQSDYIKGRTDAHKLTIKWLREDVLGEEVHDAH